MADYLSQKFGVLKVEESFKVQFISFCFFVLSFILFIWDNGAHRLFFLNSLSNSVILFGLKEH